MSCTPSTNALNPPSFPGISIPGFGLPFSPIQIPLPEFDLPAYLIEDLLALVQQLGALFPSGLFKPNVDNYMKDVMDFIMNILNQIAPFLSIYNLFTAVLNLVTCIIEVLCAIPDPIAIAFKLRKLFAECLPPFFMILPWLALLAMIIALILLIIALIEYMIQTLIKVVEEMLKNLILLGKSIALKDDVVMLSIAQKIATLFCYIENLMAIFVALAAIMAIVQTLAKMAGKQICSDQDEDENGCCTAANCPDFIKNNPDGLSNTNGKLTYYSRIYANLGIPSTVSMREERWQFLDQDAVQTYPFSDIITPIDTTTGKIYFPDIEFESDTPIGRAPYLVDLKVYLDPVTYHPTDLVGPRFFQVKDCIVVRKPYLGTIDYKNDNIGPNYTGTLNLEGGKVYEADGTTPYLVAGVQATLNTFIHRADTSAILYPVVDDADTFVSIEYILRFNFTGLVNNNLVTVGCFPGVSLERALQNAMLSAEGIESVYDKLNIPVDEDILDIAGTQQCIQNALANLRKNVSEATIAEFQSTAETCLNTLKDQASGVYCTALTSAVSQFRSTIELDTDAQFTTRPIEVTVVLKDPSNTNISSSIPDTCVESIIDNLKGTATFGEITDFIYDGTGAFISYITSTSAGAGEVSVTFNGKEFSTVTVGTDLDNPSSVAETKIPYSFIDTIRQPAVRRNESDISNDASR